MKDKLIKILQEAIRNYINENRNVAIYADDYKNGINARVENTVNKFFEEHSEDLELEKKS